MRDLTNDSKEKAELNGWKIVKPLNCEVVGKAVYSEPETDTRELLGIFIMKSTKRFAVPGGWIYNTTTEFHKGEYVSVAEALVFVPDTINDKPNKNIKAPPNISIDVD
jgi:hypothetical protein